MAQLEPIITLLAENKLSYEGVEELCKSLNQDAIREIIKGVNEYSEQHLWREEFKNGSSFVRGKGMPIKMIIDHTKDGVWPEAFMYFLVCITREHPKFVVDLYQMIKSSPKYFAIKTLVGTYTQETLLRFRKQHLTSELFNLFTEQLYSTDNVHKRETLFVLPLNALPSPEDSDHWD